jgi:hypothetical protein
VRASTLYSKGEGKKVILGEFVARIAKW